jgi:hypothetical protein
LQLHSSHSIQHCVQESEQDSSGRQRHDYDINRPFTFHHGNPPFCTSCRSRAKFPMVFIRCTPRFVGCRSNTFALLRRVRGLQIVRGERTLFRAPSQRQMTTPTRARLKIRSAESSAPAAEPACVESLHQVWFRPAQLQGRAPADRRSPDSSQTARCHPSFACCRALPNRTETVLALILHRLTVFHLARRLLQLTTTFPQRLPNDPS